MCVTFYNNFVKQLSADKNKSLGITASSTINTSGNKSIKFPPEDCYYDSNEWYALSMNEKDKVIKACSNINGCNKSTKLGGQSKSRGGRNNGHVKWRYKLSMLGKKVRNQKRYQLFFNTVYKPGSDDEESNFL